MLILITDPKHRDYNALIAQTRPLDPSHIEYRDGGVWSQLHVSQFVEMKEDEEGRPYHKCGDCYGTGNGSAYIAPFGGRNVIHTVSGCNSDCDTCCGRGVVYR